MRRVLNLTGIHAVRYLKRSIRATAYLLGVATFAAHAAQTVDPVLTVGGATIAGSTQSVPAGTNFTFYGMYSDDSAGAAESGLGLKVKYNPAHLTNVVVAEEYTKCRIAAAQIQPLTASTAQVVFGWIDTAIRSTPSVGWPDLADAISATETSVCLNPGSINTDFGAGSASGQKLFKITGSMAAGCTSAGACTSPVTLDSEGNFSYANAGSAFTNKVFTIAGAPAPSCNLDVDLSGSAVAFQDGIMIIRGMLGLTGTALTAGVPNSPDSTAVASRIAAMGNVLDVDGDGTVAGFRDGILLIRMMLGITGPALTNGVATGGASRTTNSALVGYVNSVCGTSFNP